MSHLARSLSSVNGSVSSPLHLETGSCNLRQGAGAASAQPHRGHTQAPHGPHADPIGAPCRPLKGQHQTGTACVGGPLAGRPLHILSPLVGHYTHDTHALSSKGPPASPKPHRPTAPNPPFQNTLVHPTTTTPPNHRHTAAPTTDIPPQQPGMNHAGQGEKGGRPCRCRCSASKAGP